MPKQPLEAAAEGTPNRYSLDDVISDVSNLRLLLAATCGILMEMDFSTGEGSRNDALDQVDALIHIARDQTARIEASTNANYYAIKEGRS